MSAEKAIALVLRTVDFSETSCVVTLFTREFGKVRGLAKGARRPKGPFESSLDLLSLCRIVFLHKSSDALDLLTEAKLERRFRPPGRDLTSLYAGYYVAEWLDALTEDGDPQPALFDLADETLRGLMRGESVTAWVTRFELAGLERIGLLPSLTACAECGGEAAAKGRVTFGLADGGVLCPACRPGKRHVVSVHAEVLRWMARYADRADADWASLEIPRPLAGELRGLVNHVICHLLGRRPKLYDYLGTIVH